MKSTLLIKTQTFDGIECGVILDPQPYISLSAEKRGRKNAKIREVNVDHGFYVQFVNELIAAGWVMSGGARLNFDQQLSIIENVECPLNEEYPHRS